MYPRRAANRGTAGFPLQIDVYRSVGWIIPDDRKPLSLRGPKGRGNLLLRRTITKHPINIEKSYIFDVNEFVFHHTALLEIPTSGLRPSSE